MTEAAKKLADSVTLTLAARLVSVLLAPIALAALIWVGQSITTATRMIDKHELRLEINEREIRLIKEARSQEMQALHAALAAINASLGQLNTNVAVLAQQQKENERRQDELRSYLEQRLGIKPPR